MGAMPASASVIVTGTRVIYPADAREKSVQLTNQDAFPNVVQAWVDVNNPQSTPETADAPFMITPPMFRMEPKAGQTMRL
ncbi:fimbria/pilus periplasmic chaperone, partial [Escherichia coli]|nr:fimbria/pilus periplasmic chaperone [Escherichia coli]